MRLPNTLLQMDDSYETKKVWGDKVAFLGLFIGSLLAAYLITASRSAIVFSEPIELSHTGLSLSVPSGNGWYSEKQWKHQENAFTLSSVFVSDSGRPTIVTHCQYLFAADKTTPQTKFEQKASVVNGTIVKTDQICNGMLTIDWAHIKKPPANSPPISLFFATTEMPNDRRLDIEVRQIIGDTDLAQEVFKRVTESLNFKDNHLLEAGSEIIAKIKSKGLTSFLDNQNQQVFFLVKTHRKDSERTIGFTMDVLIDSGQNIGTNIQGAGLLYTRIPYTQERITSFQSDDSFDKFVWKSETHSAAGRSGTEIILDANGVMTVRKSDVQPEEKSCRLSSAAIPTIFFQQLISVMLDSDKREIIADIIKPDGTITPTFISRIETKEPAASEQATYTLKLEFLSTGGFFEQAYLDKQKQISKRVFHLENIAIFDRATVKDILREFPERADSILQNNKVPEPNIPQEIDY